MRSKMAKKIFSETSEETKEKVKQKTNEIIMENRRNRLDLNVPAEKAIYEAMQEIEKMPPSEILTEAIILLAKAKELVSDFLDLNLKYKNENK